MKKWMNMTALALALLLLTVPAMAEQPTAIANQVVNPIVIDGSLDEWNLTSPIVVEQEAQVVRDLVFWNGALDASAKYYVMWDAEYLYLAGDVNEDSPFGALEMLPLDGEDNIELYLSVNPADDPNRTAYSSTDFKVFLVMDGYYWDTAIDRSMVEDRQRFVSKGLDGGENVLEGYECASQFSTTGFIYEAKIPWSCFSNNKIAPYTPQVNDTINFNILMTDIGYACPGTEYIPQLAWTGDLNINTNPSLWGRLTFQ